MFYRLWKFNWISFKVACRANTTWTKNFKYQQNFWPCWLPLFGIPSHFAEFFMYPFMGNFRKVLFPPPPPPPRLTKGGGRSVLLHPSIGVYEKFHAELVFFLFFRWQKGAAFKSYLHLYFYALIIRFFWFAKLRFTIEKKLRLTKHE